MKVRKILFEDLAAPGRDDRWTIDDAVVPDGKWAGAVSAHGAPEPSWSVRNGYLFNL